MTELDLSTLTGTSRTDLARFRKTHLTQGEHWTKQRGFIVYTDAGRLAMIRHLGLEKLEAPPEPGTVVTLTVRRQCRNPRIVECTDGTRHDLRLQVRDGSLFRPGMTVQATAIDALHGLYALHGQHPSRHSRA